MSIRASGAPQSQEQYINDPDITNYTSDNGLPQNSVTSIAADKEGFVWLATESGLVRYDGISFKTFTRADLGITSERFYSLQNGGDTGRRKIIALTDKNQTVNIEQGSAKFFSALPENDVAKIAQSLGENIFFIQGSKFHFDELIRPDFVIACSVPKGRYFHCIGDTVKVYDNWKNSANIYLAGNKIWYLFRLGQDLILAERNGVYTNITGTSHEKLVLSGDIVQNRAYHNTGKNHQIFWNNASGQVLIYLDKTFYLCTRGRNRSIETRKIIENIDFDTKLIKSVFFERRTRTLFLGTLTKGLFIIRQKAFRTLKDSSSSNNVYYSQLAYDSTTVLTSNGSLFNLNKPPRRLATLHAISKTSGYSILMDADENIWLPRYTRLYQYSKKQKQLLNQWDLGGSITFLHYGNRSKLWIAVRNVGLYAIDPTKPEDGPRLVIRSRLLYDVSYFQNDENDILLIGTRNGLFKFNTLNHALGMVGGTGKLYIRSLYRAQNNEIWITTNGDGLFLYKNQKLFRLPLDRDNRLHTAHCVVEDKKGFLWITTNVGLFQVKKNDLLAYADSGHKEVFYLYYSKKGGFNTNEFNGGCMPCALRLDNDFVSLPSLDGLVWFKPEDIKPLLPDRAIFIDHIESDGTLVNFDTTILQLKAETRQVRFHFSSPYMGEKQNLQWSYRLSDQQKESGAVKWINLSESSGGITLGNPGQGQYTLWIRKANGFGMNNYTVKKIEFAIEPYFYQTGWFKIFLLFIFALIFYGLVKLNIYDVEKKNVRLQQGIEASTQDLKQTLQALQSSEKRLAWQMFVQSRLVASISHDIRTPLRYIASATRKPGVDFSKAKYDELLATTDSIHHTATEMYFLLENLLGYVRIQVHKTELEHTQVCVHALVAEKLELFSSIFNESSNTYSNEIPPYIMLDTNPQLLSIIVQNLLDNANKHSVNSCIRICTEESPREVVLTIADKGPGMPQELLQWLNQAPDPGIGQELPADYTGLGLIIVKELVQLLGIRMSVVNDNGTTIHLAFKT